MAKAKVTSLMAQALIASACVPHPSSPRATTGRTNPTAPALASVSVPPAVSPVARGAPEPRQPADVTTRHGLTWYEDAPREAFEAARASGKLVLVDLWASWCHTCLSMQNFVLTAANLPRASERYVFLAIDTERAENAGFLEQFPVGVWPTFYVLSARREDGASPQVFGRWLGAAAPDGFARFLDDSARAADLAADAPEDPKTPLALIRAADRLATEKRYAEAASAYGEALSRAPADFPRRADTLVARIAALSKARDVVGCVALAKAGMPETGSSPSAADFASYALDCASDASVTTHTAGEVRSAIVRRLTPLCNDGSPELSPDDRADACDKLRDARLALGDSAGGRQAALTRLAVLVRAAEGLPDEIAVTHDWARVDTLVDLGRLEEALELCISRERALPRNYNPPAYAARVYRELRRWDEGLAAVARAIALAYGPRRLGLFSLQADLLLGAGRKDEARAVLEQQLAGYRALPAGQRQSAAEARVEHRLKELR